MPSLQAFNLLMRTAVLIDGEFFLRRRDALNGELAAPDTPERAANDILTYAKQHVNDQERDLHRIFYYDAPPLKKKVHNPITHEAIDFEKNPIHAFRTTLFEELQKRRKIALRLGYLSDWKAWQLPQEVIKSLCSGKLKWSDLTGKEFKYDVRQKGVDSRIAVDIASMAYKRQVERMVLITGDSDFVPAAKLARREGVEFVLDSMFNPIQPELRAHIDELKPLQFWVRRK